MSELKAAHEGWFPRFMDQSQLTRSMSPESVQRFREEDMLATKT
ncbi:hypothetical protein ACVOMV_14365 [Mesorhizobium atlanticum]